MRARRNALAADLVVVNHHLFFADVVLRDEGIAELLPACNTLVFDEAHQLPETARMFFGESVSTTQLTELARDARLELRAARGTAARHAAFVRGAVPAADDGPPARLDLHFRHPGRRRGFQAFHPRARRARSRDAPLGKPVRLRAPGAALRSQGLAARPERPCVHAGGDRGGAARSLGEWRARVPAVHHAAGAAARARAAAQPHRVSAAPPGHWLAPPP